MTLHDYKLACPTYQFLDHGNLCQACLGGHFQHAILRRCKDGSLGSSAVMAGELFVHTITRGVLAGARLHLPEPLPRGPHARGRRVSRDGCVTCPTSSTPRTSRSRARRARACSSPAGSRRRRESTSRFAPWARSTAACSTSPAPAPTRPRSAVLAESVAPGRVRFHGLVDKAEVQRLMLAAAVVVVPSRWYENQPMVVLEALARGVPVVGSDLGGMPELIEPGATGDLVPANDPHALAATLRPYVTDPAHGFAMRDRARATHRRGILAASATSTASTRCTRCATRARCSCVRHEAGAHRLHRATRRAGNDRRYRAPRRGDRVPAGRLGDTTSRSTREQTTRRAASPSTAGMRVRYVPTAPTKHLEALVHSGLSTAAAMLPGAHHADILHYHAIGPSVFTPLPRALTPPRGRAHRPRP